MGKNDTERTRRPIDVDRKGRVAYNPFWQGCLFYAVQEAVYFYNHTLPFNTRNLLEFSLEQAQRIEEHKQKIGPGVAGGFEVALPMICDKLEPFGIKIARVAGKQDFINRLSTVPYFHENGITLDKVGETADISFPILFCLEKSGKDYNHVWFCKNEKDFDNNRARHLNNGRLLATAYLEKISPK